MDFQLSEEQQLIQQAARDFALKEVEPKAAELDRKHEFSHELFKRMADLGFTGTCFPEEYGGSGGDDISKALIVEELAKRCASTAATLSITQITPYGILKFGTEAQKKKFLPPLLSGGNLAAFALTEPQAGSDAAAARTTALADGDHFVLNGNKCFITGGAIAKTTLVFALTEPEKGLRGMSAILVEKGTPGFSAGKVEDKLGLCGSETVELFFKDCRVPKDHLLGAPGKGFPMAMELLDFARIGVAAQGLGIAERALEESVTYLNNRVQFGKPIGAQQGLSWYAAEMKVRIEALRGLVYKAAWLKSAKLPFSLDAAVAKYYGAETACFCADTALQIHGGYGYMKDMPIERLFRDSRLLKIYEGTSEVHKLVIARGVLGLK
ncbi:MAG: acyl-CoA dehydrogenase family protein [Desulfovibrio sp.]|jgi:alkylation response protein AidB-like acyl-CoA dehydrogenase|nr:acyl-CoA dehydrogenase family protein [Desulfovibrio sp.]